MVNIVVHLINQGLFTPLKFKLPKKVWNTKKADLSYLKVFSCVSYMHIDSTTRSKLDTKSKKYFFIGYGDSLFGYHLWDD